VRRRLYRSLPWLMLCASISARASVLNALGESLLEGSATSQANAMIQEVPVSERGRASLLEPSALDERTTYRLSDDTRPGLFLMPFGHDGEPGVGIGVRVPF
jgi:hypothetical protein